MRSALSSPRPICPASFSAAAELSTGPPSKPETPGSDGRWRRSPSSRRVQVNRCDNSAARFTHSVAQERNL